MSTSELFNAAVKKTMQREERESTLEEALNARRGKTKPKGPASVITAQAKKFLGEAFGRRRKTKQGGKGKGKLDKPNPPAPLSV